MRERRGSTGGSSVWMHHPLLSALLLSFTLSGSQKAQDETLKGFSRVDLSFQRWWPHLHHFKCNPVNIWAARPLPHVPLQKRSFKHLQRFCSVKDTHGCHRNGSRWRPKRCFVARGGPSSPASWIVWMERCSLLLDFHSFHGEPGGECELLCPSHCSTMFWCRQLFLLSIPTPPSPQKTISCSFPWSTNLQCQWGRSRSQPSVPQPQLHVFAATSHSHSPASLPPLPPFKCVHHPSFFVHLSAISLSLSRSIGAYILPYIVSTF